MPWPDRKPGGLDASEKQSFAKGVFRKCSDCGEVFTADVFSKHYEVCPECGHHHKLGWREWIKLLLDPKSFEVWAEALSAKDPLEFEDGKPYVDRIFSTQKKTHSKDALQIGKAAIEGQEIAFGIFLFEFMGGSMGSVVGEKLAILFEHAAHHHLPVILLSSSGGARMQEGILSLMQMGKSVLAREKLRDAKLPFFSVLLHPTTGGVAASFALLGDVNLAEPKALIGFAGPRVIESTIRQNLPKGFQTAEFVHAHGMVDRIVSRLEMRKELASLLSLLVRRPGSEPF